jgi:hypothetical protein
MIMTDGVGRQRRDVSELKLDSLKLKTIRHLIFIRLSRVKNKSFKLWVLIIDVTVSPFSSSIITFSLKLIAG